MKKLVVCVLLLSALAAAQFAIKGKLNVKGKVKITQSGYPPPSGYIRTDFGIYYPPSSTPSLPDHSSSAYDPVFGTKIFRVTDPTDADIECGTVYSYWPSFSKNNKWLVASCRHHVLTWTENMAVFMQWNNTSGGVTSRSLRDLTYTSTYDVGTWIWSGQNEDLMFGLKCCSNTSIFQYNVATNTVSTVKDLSGSFPGKYLWQLSRSMDDDVFAATVKNQSDYSVAGYMVWKRSTDTILYSSTDYVDEVQINKSGTVLVVKYADCGGTPTCVEGAYVDLTASPPTVHNLYNGSPDYNMGHSDNTATYQVGENNMWSGSVSALNKRLLTSPWTMTSLFNPWNSSYAVNGHYSALTDDETYVYCSSHTAGSYPLAWELYMVAMDGSGAVRRFCHHRSTYHTYSDIPRPNVSRDGKWVAFTSNWNDSGRRDMYVVATFN